MIESTIEMEEAISLCHQKEAEGAVVVNRNKTMKVICGKQCNKKMETFGVCQGRGGDKGKSMERESKKRVRLL